MIESRVLFPSIGFLQAKKNQLAMHEKVNKNHVPSDQVSWMAIVKPRPICKLPVTFGGGASITKVSSLAKGRFIFWFEETLGKPPFVPSGVYSDGTITSRHPL